MPKNKIDQLTANKLVCELNKDLQTETNPARRKIIRAMLRDAEYWARNKAGRTAPSNWPKEQD